jgi:hypothetical protein
VTFSALFTAYVAAVAAAVAIVTRRWLDRRETFATLGFLALWLTFAGGLGFAGTVGERVDAFPPGIALLTLPVVIVMLAVVLTRGGAVLARSVPLRVLLGFQVYRVGVEIALHHLSSLGLAPRMMTLEGGNIEILVAITAPWAAWLVSRGPTCRRVAWLWNVIGILSLANIVARAVLTAPGPLRLIDAEPPDIAILMFPFTFIPGFMAPLALALHILAFRAFPPSTFHPFQPSSRGKENGLP